MLFRTVSSFSMLAGTLAFSALASSVIAAPSIDAWDLQRTQNQERLRVRWSEPAPVEIHTFPAARQVVVKIPEASLASTDLGSLDASSSNLLRNARIQPVTLADGSSGVQITINLNEWREIEHVSTARWLTLSYNLGGDVLPSAAPAPQQDVIRLSNEDFALLEEPPSDEYGARFAPPTGAGQAPETANQQDAFAAFYVPPDLTTEERAAQNPMADIGMLNTQGLFNRYVDLDFKDAELQNIIRSIARRLQLNIIMTPDQVSGRVTVSLSNVRLGDALDALLKANELAYTIETGGIIRIVDRETVRGSDKELETRSISINWINAADVARVIDPFMSDDGEVEFARQSNIIIIKDVPENLTELQTLVARLDIPEKQVRMETRLIDMTESASRSLGMRTSFTSEETVEAFELNEGGNFSSGDDPVLFPETLGGAGVVNPAVNALFLSDRNDISIFGSDFLLDTELRAAEERGEAYTLANPTILSLNNVPASIEIVRQLPYRDAVNTTQGSVATVKFADVGTRVDLTPRITNNGYVTMEIQPTQKIFVTEDQETGVPVVDERFAVTSVTVRDDQTVALGGLRQFESLTSETGVPWIMRVPVIQWFFKSQSNEQRKLELYLFVTPHIIKDPEPTTYEMGLYEKIDYNWDLPDFYFEEVRVREAPGEAVDPRIKFRQ